MIGNILRQERERQGLTTEDIGRRTSIRAQYIEAIENEEFGILPGEVYTKGFIRNYATLLNLDADACVQKYVEENHPEQIAAMEAAREAEEARGRREESSAGISEGISVDLGAAREDQRSGSGLGKVAAVVALAALLGGGASFLLGNDENVASNPPVQVQQEKKVAPQAKPEQAKPSASAAPAASANTAGKDSSVPQPLASGKAASDVQITATFTDRCWTKVVSDGQTVYEGTAEPGKTMAWNGKERISITAGNAGAMEITHNGKVLGKAGALGQVVDKVFTKDTVN